MTPVTPPLPSYASGTGAVPLLGDTIGANLERAVARFGDREALVEVWTGRRWTYAELDADVDALARGLLARGIAKGDRVGIWSPTCAEWTLLQYATLSPDRTWCRSQPTSMSVAAASAGSGGGTSDGFVNERVVRSMTTGPRRPRRHPPPVMPSSAVLAAARPLECIGAHSTIRVGCGDDVAAASVIVEVPTWRVAPANTTTGVVGCHGGAGRRQARS